MLQKKYKQESKAINVNVKYSNVKVREKQATQV